MCFEIPIRDTKEWQGMIEMVIVSPDHYSCAGGIDYNQAKGI